MFIQFEYCGHIECHQLTSQEATRIIEILDNHFEYRENYACGFSENSAILINGVAFYVASDGCPFLLDTSTNLFFKISREGKQEISSIFAEYGGIVFWK